MVSPNVFLDGITSEEKSHNFETDSKNKVILTTQYYAFYTGSVYVNVIAIKLTTNAI